MSKILVAGSIAYDRIMDYGGNFTDSFVPDKLHTLSVSFQVERIKEEFGGVAGNLAYNLKLLGEEPEMLGTAGSDFGRYAQYLQKLGIGVGSIHIDPSDLTSVAHIVTDRANNQIAAFAMAAGAKPYGPLPDEAFECAILGAGCVSDTIAIAAHAKAKGIKYYFDPGQAMPAFSSEDLKQVISGAAGLFCNDYELGLIEEKTGWDEAALPTETPLLVVTLGAKGSRISTTEGVVEVSAVPLKKLVDPTGAGDAHRAGFIKGIIAGLPLKQCGQLASVVAAYAVENFGTQNHRFTIAEASERYEKAYREKIALL
ncbi:carbohydrate kinase family protein [Candidatus Kaiserbacteria bacterium]|nr:carbohydrate kinase family protein [Candidatus Kaiserbacteria bacterium]